MERSQELARGGRQAAIPYYVVEGLLVVTYIGAPLWTALEGMLGKVRGGEGLARQGRRRGPD